MDFSVRSKLRQSWSQEMPLRWMCSLKLHQESNYPGIKNDFELFNGLAQFKAGATEMDGFGGLTR